MKRKIYGSLCLTAFISMLLTSVLFSVTIYRDSQSQIKQQIIVEAKYIAAAMEQSERKPGEWLPAVGNQVKKNRVTWIGGDGTVLYDNYKEAEKMENHGDRPEIIEAMTDGSGQMVRTSDTLAEETFYFAVLMQDGTILRVAGVTQSAWYSLLTLIPLLAAALLVIFGVTMTMAEVQTRALIDPINNLNLDQPEAADVYEELSPLVGHLKHQQQTIGKQLSLMKKQQREFTAITEYMSEGFLVLDSRAQVVSYNRSTLDILGADKETLMHTGSNVLNFNRSSTFRMIVDMALCGAPAEKIMELNGRYYQIIANPVAEYREHRGAVVVILDVTEKQKREELRREFSANVSHELKTPLTSISGYAEIMKNGMVKPEDIKRFSENIYQEARHLITLVEDIINLSRLDEQGEADTIEKEPVDLYEAAAQVIMRLSGNAKKNRVAVSLTGEAVTIQGAPHILEEIIYNICDNAIKYNQPEGQVEVAVFRQNQAAVVAVKDTGIGIAEHEQERIFERFYRVDKSHSRQIGGTGLGLAIVKYGARYHNAHIELYSRPGRGTVVRIIFPQTPGKAVLNRSKEKSIIK